MSNTTSSQDILQIRNKKKYTFIDILFAGYSYIVGAGIITVLPLIINKSRKKTWVAFLIGSIISIFTGLSYAKLNLDFPTNDAEYSWIIESYTTEKDKKENTTHYKNMKIFSAIIIWAVMFFGIFMSSTISVSIVEMFKKFTFIDSNNNKFMKNDKFLNGIIILIPTLINMFSSGNTAMVNNVISGITTFGLLSVIVFAIGKKYFYGDKLTPEGFVNEEFIKRDFTKNFIKEPNLLIGIFLSVFTYNGFQSIVQMSEEAKDESDIPKAMILSVGITTVIYIAVAASIIHIFGVDNSSKLLAPIVNVFSSKSDKSQNLVYFVAIITAFTTLLLSIMSRSNLLKKLADFKLAPDFLKEIHYSSPIYSVLVVGFITYLFTILGSSSKTDSIERLTGLSTIFAFFVFLFVNIGVVVKYHRRDIKTEETNEPTSSTQTNEQTEPTSSTETNEQTEPTSSTQTTETNRDPFIKFLKNTYPFYGILGAICSFIILIYCTYDFYKKIKKGKNNN